jgi:hypothetical protein
MNRIQARSPFLIKYSDTDLVRVAIQLYVYEGTQNDVTDRSNGFTYQATITPVNNSDEVIFDASEIIDSILDIEFDGTYNSQMVWVDYAITPTVLVAGEPTQEATQSIVNLEGYGGYRYFEEGVQNLSRADDTDVILLTNRVVYKGADSVVRIPILADAFAEQVTYEKNGKRLFTELVVPSTDSSSRITYISSDITNGVDNYKERVIADGGIFEGADCYRSLAYDVDLYGVDAIYVSGEKIVVKEPVCSLYDKYKVTFINRFGALQDVYFDGKSSQTMKTKSESKYRSNTLVSDSYSISRHNNRFVTKNAVDSMKLSTGFISEDYLVVFKELELSSKVWIEKDGLTLPIDLKDATFEYKNRLNDKLINYTIDVDFSFSSISNIR